MIKRYETGGLPRRQQLEFWNEVICRQFTQLECVSRSRQTYSGSLSTLDLRDLQLSMVCADASNVIHSRRLVSETREDTYLMHLQVAGESLNEQQGNRAHLQPGDFTLCSSTRPYSLAFEDPIEMLVLKIPARVLQHHLSITDHSFLGRQFSSRDPMNGALSTLVRSIWRSVDGLQHEAGLSQRVTESILSLLAVQLEAASSGISARSSLSASQAVLLMRIKNLIRDNLADVNLRPGSVAKALGISDRYLRLLMQNDGLHCGQYILDLRLEGVARSLERAGLPAFTLGELAHQWGFGSPAQFSRAFRKKFGVTPTEYRQQRQRSH